MSDNSTTPATPGPGQHGATQQQAAATAPRQQQGTGTAPQQMQQGSARYTDWASI